MRTPPVSLGLALALSLACGGGGGGGATPPPAPPTFDLQVSPASLQVPAGGSGYVTVSVSRLNGFRGDVEVAATGWPTGSSATVLVPAGATSATLPIVVAEGVSPATFPTLQLVGQGSGVTRAVGFALTVAAPLPPPPLREDAVQAGGGRQAAGALMNQALVQEPLRAATATAGTTQVRHGFLPSGSPAKP